MSGYRGGIRLLGQLEEKLRVWRDEVKDDGAGRVVGDDPAGQVAASRALGAGAGAVDPCEQCAVDRFSGPTLCRVRRRSATSQTAAPMSSTCRFAAVATRHLLDGLGFWLDPLRLEGLDAGTGFTSVAGGWTLLTNEPSTARPVARALQERDTHRTG
jgi:hypothetical protein